MPITDIQRRKIRQIISGQDDDPVTLETDSSKVELDNSNDDSSYDIEDRTHTEANRMNIEINKDEVFDMMFQLYPDQTNRCIAEVKAQKLEQALESATNEYSHEEG